MQKKLNLVLLALKMVILGYVIDTINYLVCKAALSRKRKTYRLLMASDNILHVLRDEFERTEKIYLAVFESRKLKLTAND